MRKYVIIYPNIQAFFIYISDKKVPLLTISKNYTLPCSNNKNDNGKIYLSIRYEAVNDDSKLMLQDENNLPRAWTHAAINKAKRPIVRYCHMTISGFYPDPLSTLYILPPTPIAHSFLKPATSLDVDRIEEQWEQKMRQMRGQG